MSFGAIGRPAPYTGPQAPPDQLASRIMDMKDYAVLNRRTQETGSFIGFGGGAGLAYGIHKVRPSTSRNTLFLTFFTSATILSYLSSTYLLTHRMAEIRSQLKPTGGVEVEVDPSVREWQKAQEHPLGTDGEAVFGDRFGEGK